MMTFTLLVLSPGGEDPSAQAGIDCSFFGSDARLRRGSGQDTTGLVVRQRARPTVNLFRLFSLTFA